MPKFQSLGLLPLQAQYQQNQYIDIYQYTCKKNTGSATQNLTMAQKLERMYQMGLQLQSKIDKLRGYDQCKDDQVKSLGVQKFCVSTTKKSQLLLWNDTDTNNMCSTLEKNIVNLNSNDLCAEINDGIFNQYHNTQNDLVSKLVQYTGQVIDKRKQKQMKMQALLEEEEEGESVKVGLDKEIIVPAPPTEFSNNATIPKADSPSISVTQTQTNHSSLKNISIPKTGTSTA